VSTVPDQLEKLVAMLDRGLITREQFDAQRDQLLAGGGAARAPVTAPPVAASDPSMRSAVGAYGLTSLIGEGGMGAVYRGRHRSDTLAERQGGDVAIKVMHPQYARDPGYRDRFEREASLGLKLAHPGIVTVHDLVVDGGELALVMDHVDGRPLTESIGEAVGPVPWERAWPLFERLLDAVAYAHAQGVVHRDLKPDNILLTADGTPWIIDFGIAKDLDASGTRTGTGMGTVEYMAPEQYTDAKAVDARADVYSLGMILYEMLAGRLPWEATAPQFEILEQKARRGLVSPAAYCPTIPPAVVAALAPALSADPESRPPSAQAFREHLLGANSGHAQAPPVAPGPVAPHAPPPQQASPAPAAPHPSTPPRIGSAPTMLEPAGVPGPGRGAVSFPPAPTPVHHPQAAPANVHPRAYAGATPGRGIPRLLLVAAGMAAATALLPTSVWREDGVAQWGYRFLEGSDAIWAWGDGIGRLLRLLLAVCAIALPFMPISRRTAAGLLVVLAIALPLLNSWVVRTVGFFDVLSFVEEVDLPLVRMLVYPFFLFGNWTAVLMSGARSRGRVGLLGAALLLTGAAGISAFLILEILSAVDGEFPATHLFVFSLTGLWCIGALVLLIPGRPMRILAVVWLVCEVLLEGGQTAFWLAEYTDGPAGLPRMVSFASWALYAAFLFTLGRAWRNERQSLTSPRG